MVLFFSIFQIPNLKNDGHDTGVEYAGRWLTEKFASVWQNSQILSDTLFIITFDESANNRNNQIYTLLIGAGIKAGSKSEQHGL